MVDFDCAADTAAIRDLASHILREQSTPERLSSLDRAGTWFDQRTYQALADADVLGAAFGQDVGGAGLGLLELHFVLEQAGATTARVPLAGDRRRRADDRMLRQRRAAARSGYPASSQGIRCSPRH